MSGFIPIGLFFLFSGIAFFWVGWQVVRSESFIYLSVRRILRGGKIEFEGAEARFYGKLAIVAGGVIAFLGILITGVGVADMIVHADTYRQNRGQRLEDRRKLQEMLEVERQRERERELERRNR